MRDHPEYGAPGFHFRLDDPKRRDFWREWKSASCASIRSEAELKELAVELGMPLTQSEDNFMYAEWAPDRRKLERLRELHLEALAFATARDEILSTEVAINPTWFQRFDGLKELGKVSYHIVIVAACLTILYQVWLSP